MGRVRGAVNARALSLARKAVDLCNCWRREAAAECLVEKQVELLSLSPLYVRLAYWEKRERGLCSLGPYSLPLYVRGRTGELVRELVR